MYSVSQMTYKGRQRHTDFRGQLGISPDEDRVGITAYRVPCADAKIAHGTNHVVKAHKVSAPEETEDDGTEKRADEALDSLLRREGDERGAAEGHSPDVGEDVVADD